MHKTFGQIGYEEYQSRCSMFPWHALGTTEAGRAIQAKWEAAGQSIAVEACRRARAQDTDDPECKRILGVVDVQGEKR